MTTSPVCPKFETANYPNYEFDPQADFTRFLEARILACEGNFKASSQHIEETGHTQLNGEKENRKSWKSSLFSWLKSGKTNKAEVEPLSGSTIPKLRRGIVSGPIHGTAIGITSRPWKPTSGPLMGLFNLGKREEDGIPYMCLNQLNNPHDAQSYGPVYLVT